MNYSNKRAKDIFEKAYAAGKRDGVNDGIMYTYKTCYCASVLAAAHLFTDDEDKLLAFLGEMHDMTLSGLSAEEMTIKLYDELGLKIDFGDGLEPFKKEDF